MMQGTKRNWMAKILSVAGAILLWVYVMNEQNPIVEATYTVEVEKNLTENTMIIENVPDTVHVTLRGPRNSILSVRQSDIRASINLMHLNVGEQAVAIDVIGPRGLSIVSQNPVRATVIADLYEAKTMPIHIRREGSLSDTQEVRDMKPSVDKVIISGPKRFVDSVRQVAATVKLDNRKSSFTEEVALAALDGKGNVVSEVALSPRIVQVSAKVGLKGESGISVLPVLEGKPASGYVVSSVDVTPENVKLEGKPEIVSKITSLSTEPINISNATEDVVKEVPLVDIEKVTLEDRIVKVVVKIRKILPGEEDVTNR